MRTFKILFIAFCMLVSFLLHIFLIMCLIQAGNIAYIFDTLIYFLLVIIMLLFGFTFFGGWILICCVLYMCVQYVCISTYVCTTYALSLSSAHMGNLLLIIYNRSFCFGWRFVCMCVCLFVFVCFLSQNSLFKDKSTKKYSFSRSTTKN